MDILATSLESMQRMGIVELPPFKVPGAVITLSSLSVDDDILIASQMASVPTEGLEYYQTYKLWILAYSICQINDINFRGAATIIGKDGKPVVRQEYLFGLVKSWDRAMLNVCFKKYGELLTDAEEIAEKDIEWKVVDYDAEITRYNAKIAELTQAKTKRDDAHPVDAMFKEPTTPEAAPA
jgi:hypothetical protein